MIVDLHAHILPGLDRGCPNTQTALHLLRRAARAGVTHITAASAYDPTATLPEVFLRRRDAAVSELLQHKEAQALRLIPAAEVIWCPGLEKLSALESLCFGDGNLLLRVQPGESPLAVAASIPALKARLHGEILLTNAERLPAGDAALLIARGARCVLPFAALSDRIGRRALLPWLTSGRALGLGSGTVSGARRYRKLWRLARRLGPEWDRIMTGAAALALPQDK